MFISTGLTMRGLCTNQAGGGRVLLDGLCHVVLDLLPELPLKAWMENVEGLEWVEPPVPLVLSEDGVVGPVVPLKRNSTSKRFHLLGSRLCP